MFNVKKNPSDKKTNVKSLPIIKGAFAISEKMPTRYTALTASASASSFAGSPAPVPLFVPLVGLPLMASVQLPSSGSTFDDEEIIILADETTTEGSGSVKNDFTSRAWDETLPPVRSEVICRLEEEDRERKRTKRASRRTIIVECPSVSPLSPTLSGRDSRSPWSVESQCSTPRPQYGLYRNQLLTALPQIGSMNISGADKPDVIAESKSDDIQNKNRGKTLNASRS